MATQSFAQILPQYTIKQLCNLCLQSGCPLSAPSRATHAAILTHVENLPTQKQQQLHSLLLQTTPAKKRKADTAHATSGKRRRTNVVSLAEEEEEESVEKVISSTFLKAVSDEIVQNCIRR
jgi:hypothetical protein